MKLSVEKILAWNDNDIITVEVDIIDEIEPANGGSLKVTLPNADYRLSNLKELAIEKARVILGKADADPQSFDFN